LAGEKVIMFGGKGGVGKTTCAGATALHYADAGLKTLIISTDPTPSLADIFEAEGTQKPVHVTGRLSLAELGIDEVKEMWNRRFGREVYEVFSSLVSIEYDEFTDFVTSILPGLQEEFMIDYIRELVERGEYEKIVWDTAPLGQTIHLLNMPGLLRDHLKPAPRIYSRLKLGGLSRRSIMNILEDWSRLSTEDMRFLREDVAFNLVTIPEALAVQQLESIFGEFARHGFSFHRVIINNVITSTDSPFLRSRREQQQGYLETIHRQCEGIETLEVPLFPYEIKGLGRLAETAGELFPETGGVKD